MVKADPANTQMQGRPDALMSVSRGSVLLRDRGYYAFHSDIARVSKLVSSRSAYAALPPGRACTTRVARPFPFSPRKHADNFTHRLLAPSLNVSTRPGRRSCDTGAFQSDGKIF